MQPTGIALRLAILAVLAWIDQFLLVRGYGFYEDDYWAIAPFLQTTPSELATIFLDRFQNWPQGRPLNHFMPPLFASLGHHLAGGAGIYALVYFVLVLNAWLIFALVKRACSERVAFVAGATYIFFPADTSRILMTYGAHVHSSIAYALLGLLLIPSVRRRLVVLAYPVAAISLLSYESAFLIFFFGAPAYRATRREWSWRFLAQHCLACLLTLSLVAGVRMSKGEGRAREAASDLGKTVYRSVSSLVIGPPVSLGSFQRAWSLWRHGVSLTSFALFLLVAALLGLGLRGPREPVRKTALLWLAVSGCAIWIFGYALTLINYPPNQLAGRLSNTHMVASVLAHSWGDANVLRLIWGQPQSGIFLTWVSNCNPLWLSRPEGLCINSEPWYGLFPLYRPETTILIDCGQSTPRRVTQYRLDDGKLLEGRPLGSQRTLRLTEFAQTELLLKPENHP